MSARKPYVRPMAGWWRRNPFFIEYMVHEGTAVFVAAYALILLVSLFVLCEGEAAWNKWLVFLTSPFCIAMHIVILLAFLYHTWTWFNIMPRTMPPILINGQRVKASTITFAGLAAAAISSMIVFGIVAWLPS